jgi:DNA repair exonuclease SbcCD ATPase subunit
MEDIPAEERENILREIDLVLSKNRIVSDTQYPKEGKPGIGLPIIVNLIIIVTIAAAVFLFTRTLNGEERQLTSGAREIKGAENQVVEALRQESAAQLGQKDQEIVAVQKRLQEASAESTRLQNQTAETIRKREEELSAQMASSLAAERQRLQSSGLNSDTQDARLRAYEDRLKAETAKQAELFRKKAEDEAAASVAAVNGLIAGYQRNLSQAQDERAQLQQQYKSQEAELKSRYEKDSKSLQAEKNQAVSDLDRFQELQRQENLVMGRMLSSYDDIDARIKAGDNQGALKDISELRDSLDREPAKSLAAIQNRRPIELFILGSLEELVRYHIERDSGDAAALVDTKTHIAALREKAAQAEKKYLSKDLTAARELYLAALAEVPEARTSYDRLNSMALAERAAQDEASRQSEQSLIAQETFLRQQDAAKRAILPNRIDLMKKELMKRPDESGNAQEPDFASLLQAKLLLWQIIGTDPIKSKYPKLYDTMQKYFDTFASQQQHAGRDAALGEVLALTESLQKGQTKAPATPASDRDSMVRLLDGLERLMKE